MTLPDPAQPDQALRALYQQAQDTISPATTARLHRARHAALTRPATRRGWALPLASGVAAACVLAFAASFGFGFSDPHTDASAALQEPLAAAERAADLDEAMDETLADYEESPDFYRWLAANESTFLAAE